MFTTNSLCPIVCSIHEWCLFRGLPTAFFPQILRPQGCLLQTRYAQLYAVSMSVVYFEVFPWPLFQILLLQGCLLQTRYAQLYALSMSGI